MIRSKNQYLLRNRVSECDCISFEFTNVEERLTNAEKCPRRKQPKYHGDENFNFFGINAKKCNRM